MSVAVAVRKGGVVALATDSQTDFGDERVPPHNFADTKYHRIGNAYLAATGWGIYANILDDVLARAGKRTPRLDDSARIFAFFNRLWSTLHDRYTFVRDQADERETPFGSLDSTFLVVAPTGIFHVSSNLTVTPLERYASIGSGSLVALGAVHALYDEEGLDAETIVRRAAEAAIDHNIYCGPPVNLVSVRARVPRRPARK